MKTQPNGAEPIAALIVVGVFAVLIIDTVRGTQIPSDMMVLLSTVIVAVTSFYFGVHAASVASASAQESATAAVKQASEYPLPAPAAPPAAPATPSTGTES